MIAFLLASVTDTCYADEGVNKKKPLWELGLFNSAMTFPHYRGSDEQMYYLLAIPYFIYRGEIFKADRDGKQIIHLSGRDLQGGSGRHEGNFLQI